MASNDPKKPAERISDEELLDRVRAKIGSEKTPFITTKQAHSVVDELTTSDQVRERLKNLAEEKDELTYTRPYGLVFWFPDEEGLTGEISLEIQEDEEPNWENTNVEDLPPSLLEEAAKEHNRRETTYPRINAAGRLCGQVGIVLVGIGFVGILIEEVVLPGSLSSTHREIVVVAVLGGFVMVALGLVLSWIDSLGRWIHNTDWNQIIPWKA